MLALVLWVSCCCGTCQCLDAMEHWGSRCSGTLVRMEKCPLVSRGMPWKAAAGQGMLLSRGLANACAPSVAPACWAEYLAGAGLLKAVPGLPGHSTRGWDMLRHSSPPHTVWLLLSRLAAWQRSGGRAAVSPLPPSREQRQLHPGVLGMGTAGRSLGGSVASPGSHSAIRHPGQGSSDLPPCIQLKKLDGAPESAGPKSQMQPRVQRERQASSRAGPSARTALLSPE